LITLELKKLQELIEYAFISGYSAGQEEAEGCLKVDDSFSYVERTIKELENEKKL